MEQWTMGKEFEQDNCHRMVGLTIIPLLGRWTSWLMRSRSSRVETILTGQMYCTWAMWRCPACAPPCFPLCCFKKLHMLRRNSGCPVSMVCRVAKIVYGQRGKKLETRTDTSDTQSLAASLVMPGCRSCRRPSRHFVLGELMEMPAFGGDGGTWGWQFSTYNYVLGCSPSQ